MMPNMQTNSQKHIKSHVQQSVSSCPLMLMSSLSQKLMQACLTIKICIWTNHNRMKDRWNHDKVVFALKQHFSRNLTWARRWMIWWRSVSAATGPAEVADTDLVSSVWQLKDGQHYVVQQNSDPQHMDWNGLLKPNRNTPIGCLEIFWGCISPTHRPLQRNPEHDWRHKFNQHVLCFFPPNYFQRNISVSVGLSPGHTDARVQIIELGGTQSNLFVLFSVSCLNLQLQQLLLASLHHCLFPLYQPDGKYTHRGAKQSKTEEIILLIYEWVTKLWCFPSSLFVITCVNRSIRQHHVCRKQIHQK